MIFQKKLDAIIDKNNSLVCIGLDPEKEKLSTSIFEFNKAIIDATRDLVCAYKPNIAFYEAGGIDGLTQLKQTLEYLKKNYPDVPTILDAKRGDIGNSSKLYAKAMFEYWDVDAITLNPFSGNDSLQPFLDYKDRGNFIWCKSSNPGGGEFQDLLVNDELLYLKIAKNVADEWNKNDNCMLVVGATYTRQIAQVRSVVGDITLLVPGIGAQGGSVEDTVKAGLNSQKKGLIISASRSIIYASTGKDFAEQAKVETSKLRDDINKYR